MSSRFYLVKFTYVLVIGLQVKHHMIRAQLLDELVKEIKDPTLIAVWKVNENTVSKESKVSTAETSRFEEEQQLQDLEESKSLTAETSQPEKEQSQDSEESKLSIVVPSKYQEEFIFNNALIIWKGDCVDPSRYLYYWLGRLVEPNIALLAARLAMKKSLKKCHRRPIINREVQGYESPAFRSYFKQLPWKDEDLDEPIIKKLFFVKGNDRPRIKQVPVAAEWLQKGGCLVLFMKTIFLYCSESSIHNEVQTATKFAENLRKDQGEERRVHRFIPDDSRGPPTSPKMTQQRFRTFLFELGLNRLTYNSLRSVSRSTSEEEDDYEKIRDAEISIISLSLHTVLDGEDERFEVQENILDSPPKMESLNSHECVVLDSASDNGIFVWIGKESDDVLKIHAAERAERIVNIDKKYFLQTPITVVEEDTEPLLFKINFVDGLDER